MAKKKDVEISEDYLSASYILDRPRNIIKISPGIDLILNGGWPDGTIGILESPPKIGKTTLALKIAAKAQQQYNKTIIYSSIENRLSTKNLMGVKELDTSSEKFKLIASTEGKILGTEQHLEKAERALYDFPNSVLIFDSFSSLSSSAEKTKSYGEGYGGMDSRKLEGEFARRVSPILSVNNSTIIGIAHISPNINTHGNSTKISRAMMYQLDIRLSLKKSYPNGDWICGDKVIGQKTNIECITSALGPPGGNCTSWLHYGNGFLDSGELAELACDLSLINKKGAGWYDLEKYNEKVQGFYELCKLLEERKDIYKSLLESVEELLK